MESLFEHCVKQHEIEAPKTKAETIISEVECEFNGQDTPRMLREKEFTQLHKTKKELEAKLAKIKNPRRVANPARRDAIVEKNKQLRNTLRSKIAKIDLRLGEINIEKGEKPEDDKKETVTERLKRKVGKPVEADEKTVDVPVVEKPSIPWGKSEWKHEGVEL